MNILQSCADPNLFARWFRDGADWSAWATFLAALFGLALTPQQLELYRQCTGRQTAPTAPAEEAWLVCGRRAGKSFTLALVAVYLASFRDYRSHLAPGERGTILVIACDRRQARVILRYVRALLTEVPMLARLVERETAESFDLSNVVSIEVATASFRSTRGYTLVAALCDELAFWQTDGSAEPDFEVLDALRPGMATIPGAMLLCASSPYARRGALWEAFRRHWAKDGDPVLLWRAATRVMNSSVPQSLIDRALARDRSSARAEWLAEFRADIEGFVAREIVEACVEVDCHQRPPARGRKYVAFVDPSGGSNDSMTMCIAHREKTRDGARVVIDAMRESAPPFSPMSVVHEFSKVLEPYDVRRVVGDRYAGEWPREQFRKRGVLYEPAARPKGELYVNLLPLLNANSIVLPDHERLVQQLVGLERRTTRGGRDSIDHAPGGHDDLANAVAGAAWLAQETARRGEVSVGGVEGLY